MMKEKARSLLDRVKPTVRRVTEFLFWREPSFTQRFCVPIIVKYLYILLTVVLLTNHGYVGNVTYQVNFNVWKELLASAVFLPVAYVQAKLPLPEHLLRLLMRFLFILYYIPLNSAFALNNTSFGFFLLSNLYFILLMVAVYGLCILLKKWQAKRPVLRRPADASLLDNANIRLFCALICVAFIVHKLFYNGLSFSLSFETEDVYGNRSDYQAYLLSIAGTPLSYVLTVLRNLAPFVAPLYLTISLLRKKVLPILLSVVCILSMFSVSSDKGKLLITLVVVALYLLHRLKLMTHFERVFDVGILALLAVCLIEAVFRDRSTFYSLLVRREMYIPSWMNSIYYDFFSDHAKVLWTQDVFLLKNLFSFAAPYNTSPLYVISNVYFEGLVPSPNTGMFAEAYMHFGVFGALILYPVLLAAVFKLTCKILQPYGTTVGVLMLVQLTLRLVNVPVTRADSVLGIFLLLLILWVLPKFPSVQPLLDKIPRIKRR